MLRNEKIRRNRRVWTWAANSTVAAALAVVTVAPASAQATGAVQAISELDLERYSGSWYEIARLPNRFQDRCVADVRASYELRRDSTVTVINSCRTASGDSVRVEGRARLADRRGSASRLKVRFAPAVLSFLPMVWADYWVLDLTDDYRAALVGTPDRRYLWILSREPQLDSATYDRLLSTAVAQGFDIARLQRTERE